MKRAGLLLGLAIVLPTFAQDSSRLPPVAKRTVSYSKDIHPIFAERCADCHLNGKRKGGLQLDSREAILKGGEDGPVVVIGKSAESRLVQLVSSTDPDKVMPKKGERLSAEQVGLLRAWIDQGLSWDVKDVAARKKDFKPAPLAPRRPTVPLARGELTNPIDLILEGYSRQKKVSNEAVVDDRTFARRVYLDVIGLLPTPTELNEFLADKRPDKREQLVARLLADNRRYAEHWLTFWNDALRNDYQGTGYIDGGRKQITQWLYDALYNNLSYDRFTGELVSPSAKSAGFVNGIVWRGVVNASQTPPLQAAQNIPQVFLATNLKCASCHDSFINDWKLADAYGLAAIYSDKPLEMYRCDQEPRGPATVKFLYPQLGQIESTAPKSERTKQLAALLISPQNGRFARTIVNRLWARFLGRGIVEPTDDLDQSPWSDDLLDWLASDLVDNGYDLKKTMARILTSRAYQRPVMNVGEQTDSDFIFRGPSVRRLSAEQFVDAVYQITNTWPTTPSAQIDSISPATVNAKWIWSEKNADKGTAGGRIFLRKEIDLPSAPSKAVAIVTCDNEFALYINGKKLGESADWQQPRAFDLRGQLVSGTNIIAIEAINWPDTSTGKGLEHKSPNPAAIVFYGRVTARTDDGKEKNQEIKSGASWKWSTTAPEGWNKTGFADDDWKRAAELGDVAANFYGIQGKLNSTFAALWGDSPRVRAALQTANPLMVALGRPNREQVVTSRPYTATTLQTLELTNGGTLANLLSRGATNWVARQKDGTSLVTELYQHSLGRAPTAAELRAAIELVGASPTKAGVEDLLWSVLMLPEFQLIY